MTIRQAAFLRRTDRPPAGRAPHYWGLPSKLGGTDEQRTAMPWPRVLILEQRQSGDFLLLRFAEDGAFAGDTWHASLDDAKAQAEHEYRGLLEDWRDIPPDVPSPDALSFVLDQLKERE